MINKTLYYRLIECDSNKQWFNRRSNVQAENVEACAGLLKEDLIMIDTDRDNDSNLLLCLIDELQLNCNVMQSLNGIHAIFKKPIDYHVKSDSKLETVTGIIVDVKQGRRNVTKTDLDIVKRFGSELDILQYCEHDDLDELPWQLRIFNSRLNLQLVGEGDGRHSVHQRLIGRWQAYVNSNAEEARKWVQWVNDYVFAVPRESVNWHVKDIQKWYDSHPITGNSVPKTRDDVIKLLDSIDCQDMSKIYSYVSANFDRGE